MDRLELAKNSGLHDFEVMSLVVDYAKATIILNMVSPLLNNTSSQISMCISNFISFSISRQEPWGSGKYIYSSDIQNMEVGIYKLEIQLNSGDLIIVNYRQDKGTVLPAKSNTGAISQKSRPCV